MSAQDRTSQVRWLQWTVQVLAIAVGTGMLAAALRLDAKWVSRHVIQPNLWPEPDVGPILLRLRWIAASFGIAVLLVFRPLLVRHISSRGLAGPMLGVLIGVACSLATFEAYLRWREKQQPLMTHEILGAPHPRYGWTWAPLRVDTESVEGRDIRWVFNDEGVRIPLEGSHFDPNSPTILFTGESIAAGQGLQYEETYPALVSAHLHLQAVNLAVNAYGVDQAYLRLVDALPKYRNLVATVTVFLPVQLGRNLLDNRPRLVLGTSGTPELVPPLSGVVASLRLRTFLWNTLRFCGDAALDRSLTLTARLLRDTAEQTRARGAVPVFIIPSYGPFGAGEERRETWIVQTLFERQHLPFAVVDLPPDRVLGNNPHPNPRGAAAIAGAVEEALGRAAATGDRRLPTGFESSNLR